MLHDGSQVTVHCGLFLSRWFVWEFESLIWIFTGRYVATGSADTSLKVLDVSKMKNVSSSIPVQLLSAEDKPLIRTLYDHTDPVNDVAFHPNGRALASCSDDCTIKLYDLQRVGIKRAFRHLQVISIVWINSWLDVAIKDSHPIKSISFHPSGDFLLAGTEDNVVHLFDVNTMKCFRPVVPEDQHHGQGGIRMVQYAPQGDFYISCGLDCIRVWDGTNNRCIRQLTTALNVCPISIRISIWMEFVK